MTRPPPGSRRGFIEMATVSPTPDPDSAGFPTGGGGRWTDCLGPALTGRRGTPANRVGVGAFIGEGIGAEVVGAAVTVLRGVLEASGLELDLRYGGPIGRDGERECGNPLPPEAIDFCRARFAENAAILCGPGGGRFVYDLRREFDLFFKISPLQVANGLADASRLKPEFLDRVDILLVRENSAGLYQGDWGEETKGAHQRFGYTEIQVRRFLEAAARLSRIRSGRLTVVWKESGVPAISRLWQRCLDEIAKAEGVTASLVDIDLMAYRLIQDAAEFDVVAAPNLFGDVLGDLGAVLLGSRGISYSGNYAADGRAVYQTNHGAAYDLAGRQVANPAGQIFSAAMMLRESFGLDHEARAIEAAVRSVWSEGWRTEDVAVPGCRLAGTDERADRIAARAVDLIPCRATEVS